VILLYAFFVIPLPLDMIVAYFFKHASVIVIGGVRLQTSFTILFLLY